MPILTLTQGKAQLGITTDVHNTELTEYIAGVEQVVVKHIGPVDDVTITEDVAGGRRSLILSRSPLVSVTSVTLDDGTEVTGPYIVDSDPRVPIVRRQGSGLFPLGRLRVVYVAGRGGACPPAASIAARIILQHLWATQRGPETRRPPITSAGDDDLVQVAGLGFAVPRRAVEMLQPDSRGPVVA